MRISHITAEIFFFNDTATTEIYTLSLHDALPIFVAHPVLGELLLDDVGLDRHAEVVGLAGQVGGQVVVGVADLERRVDRKSTRLNSSHANISYAVFCL